MKGAPLEGLPTDEEAGVTTDDGVVEGRVCVRDAVVLFDPDSRLIVYGRISPTRDGMDV